MDLNPKMTIMHLAMFSVFLAACPAMAVAAAADLPPERIQGEVLYRSGGIGEDEAKAMQEAAREYPLALEFVAREGDGHGAFLADVDVSIRDAGGNQVLRTRSDGPYLLARLPAGRYVITARHEDTPHERRITIPARGGRHVTFGW